MANVIKMKSIEQQLEAEILRLDLLITSIIAAKVSAREMIAIGNEDDMKIALDDLGKYKYQQNV